MHYAPEQNDHGLPHDPFKAAVVPRPIAWISSISRDGVHNLAPYSQFQNLSFDSAFEMVIPGDNRDLLTGLEGKGGAQQRRR